MKEAAGIVKIPHAQGRERKRAFQHARQPLRVEDIIAELEGQLEPLEKASETARRYLNLRDELRVWNVPRSFCAVTGRRSESLRLSSF